MWDFFFFFGFYIKLSHDLHQAFFQLLVPSCPQQIYSLSKNYVFAKQMLCQGKSCPLPSTQLLLQTSPVCTFWSSRGFAFRLEVSIWVLFPLFTISGILIPTFFFFLETCEYEGRYF